jgi:exosortase/archaeosortase family protein
MTNRLSSEPADKRRGLALTAAWCLLSAAAILTVYSYQVAVLTSGLDALLTSTLGSTFPAYPFLALLVVITTLQWKRFYSSLSSEASLTELPLVRVSGTVLMFAPAVLWAKFIGPAGSSDYLAMEVAAVSLVSAVYGALLIVSPSTWRLMLPYAGLYVFGLVTPLALIQELGPTLAGITGSLTAGVTGTVGPAVAWQGVNFSFVSTGGQTISSYISPACSAAYSISIYLALLGLMKLDTGGTWRTTSMFAVAGVILIPLVDVARISTMIWFGYLDGPTAFWGVHDWLGYALFFAFYVVAMTLYFRATGDSSSFRYSDRDGVSPTQPWGLAPP